MNITNESVTEYLNSYYKPVNNKLSVLRELGEKDRIPIILKDTEDFLRILLRIKNPVKILEIGTAIGYSAVFFASICPQADIYTIEKDEYAFNAAKHNIKQLSLDDRIHQIFGDGEEQIDKLRDRGIHGFDFVFIDAAKSHYKRFFTAALSVCTKDAVIVSDNILQKGMTASERYDPKGKHKTSIKKMREYVEYITSNADFDTSLEAIGDGVAVTIYRGEHGQR